MFSATGLRAVTQEVVNYEDQFKPFSTSQPGEPAYNAVLEGIAKHFAHASELQAKAFQLSEAPTHGDDKVADQQLEIARLIDQLSPLVMDLDVEFLKCLRIAGKYESVENEPVKKQAWQSVRAAAEELMFDIRCTYDYIDELFDPAEIEDMLRHTGSSSMPERVVAGENAAKLAVQPSVMSTECDGTLETGVNLEAR